MADDDHSPRLARSTRPRHRVPVRLRQHWKPAAAVLTALAVLVLAFGEARIRPYVTSELVSADTVVEDVAGTADLFGDGAHAIEVTFDRSEYEEMLETFREEGEKEYIRADVVIDGTAVSDVGLRLKGNSTLMGLRSDGGDGEDADTGRAGGPSATTLSDDQPETLPWLISFDEFAEGRAYQGHTEIALRPATSTSDTALNEALALELTAADGQTAQDHAFTSVTVNGGEAATRILVDAPDAQWADALGDGVLYKAGAEGSLEYLGGDPTDYEDAFTQINDEGGHDLQPVMDLLEFIEEADDEEFAEELDAYLDTEAFARYLALQALISNGDAMDGPGNNYYLWYDTEEERFTVLSWDLNGAFGGMGMGFGADAAGGGQLPGGAEAPEGMQPPGGGEFQGTQTPEGTEAPEGDERSEGMAGGGRGSGELKERFLADAGFEEMYRQAYADMYEDLIAGGTAADLLEDIVASAEAAGDEGAAQAGERLAESIAAVAETPQEAALPGPRADGVRQGTEVPDASAADGAAEAASTRGTAAGA
ncbi:CotH kinase family protein [Nocardiopsis sp. NPDC050513]|uniref:CotH kinase family protein n=1 Tax=Nocardiopsis sp. NPDC050513 TaxID=3364338 RepID=UPI0037A50A63